MANPIGPRNIIRYSCPITLYICFETVMWKLILKGAIFSLSTTPSSMFLRLMLVTELRRVIGSREA